MKRYRVTIEVTMGNESTVDNALTWAHRIFAYVREYWATSGKTEDAYVHRIVSAVPVRDVEDHG